MERKKNYDNETDGCEGDSQSAKCSESSLYLLVPVQRSVENFVILEHWSPWLVLNEQRGSQLSHSERG